MKIKIEKATQLSNQILISWGFTLEKARYITDCLLEAEMSGKASHGLMRVVRMHSIIVKKKYGGINIEADYTIENETAVSLLVNGNWQTGWYVVPKVLEMALEKVKTSGMLVVGFKDTAYAAGMIGSYARRATQQDKILIAFVNSDASLIPYGASEALWGTNVFAAGIPSNGLPVVFDACCTKMNAGSVLLARNKGEPVPEGILLDPDGNPTTDAALGWDGGILPIGEHKGSGLAFVVELLGGALTYSKVGNIIAGGWGVLFMLIDPEILRPLAEFKADVDAAIAELKNARKADGVEEIYFPGEQSQRLRQRQLEAGEIEISDKLYDELLELHDLGGLEQVPN